jgi:hypothetical protein
MRSGTGCSNEIGIFDLSALTATERENYAANKHYFWFGEDGMASILAGIFAVPLGIFLAGRAEITLGFTGSALLLLALFIFLPKIFRKRMGEVTDAAIDAFGKNEHLRKIFRALFVAVVGLVMTQVFDPGTVQEMVKIITADV